jgi:hypothetical protein
MMKVENSPGFFSLFWTAQNHKKRFPAGGASSKSMQARRAACFDKADTNHDGQLSRDEFTKMGEVCGMGHGGRGHMPPPAPPAAPVAPVKK